MRVVVVARLQHLHAVHADPRPHRVLGSAQAELGHAVQQHVVELREQQQEREARELITTNTLCFSAVVQTISKRMRDPSLRKHITLTGN